MEIMKYLIVIILIIYANNQVPRDKSINSCGKIGYDMPSESDCKEPPEFCCFVHLVNPNNASDFKKFCAIAPSKIDKNDIGSDIFTYTGYELKELKCNSNFLNLKILLLIIFILF